MKKLFALFLALVLLLPMGVVAHAEEVGTKPFYLVNWSDFHNDYVVDGYTNVFYMPHVRGNTSDVAEVAKTAKAYYDTCPEGARYINFTFLNGMFYRYAEDVCFMGKVVTMVQQWLESFLIEYQKIGGKLDGLAADLEYLNIYGHYIHDNYFTKDPKIYSKIQSNEEYKTKIRPQLVERGFKFYENITENTPEIYSIHPKSGEQYAVSRAIWDTVMRSYLGQCITEACSPVWKYYPDAVVSDYQSKNVKPWLKEPNDGGDILGGGGNQSTAGNSCNENFYFIRPTSTFYTDPTTKGPLYKNLPGRTNALYEATPFNRFRYDSILAKDTYLASDSGNVSWWIAHYVYTKSSNNAYYAETLFHLGMLNPQIFLGYIYDQEFLSDMELFEFSLEVVDDCLQELTRVVGAADRKPIYIDPNWNHNFVLSGMYAGGKNIWRLTPDTSMVSVEDFKVEGTDPTFSVGGQTITFPGGKIIETSAVSHIGTCGYWIETATDVNPVITRTENYFRQYPAFQENYEDYEAGTEYTYNNALPEACWEPTKSGGGVGTVVADPAGGENKVLALKGNYTLKNVKIVKNITAGDTYAKHQAWEVSFTLPSDLAADAELVLLNATGEKKKSADGGFKIKGGKVYYSQGEEYVELPDVTLSANNKYTVIRDMDFTNEEAITCDYYVYDAAGKELGKAMDIPVAALTLPAGGISIGCKGVAGEAVLLDDYKLYPTDVATDLYLYDAATGMKVAEPEKARAGQTAFRLSWLNATEKEKTYSVVAAYYEGETLVSEQVVSEVKMAPNGDGVITGVAKETEGKTLRVYLRDDSTENGSNQQDHTVLIIAGAAAAVIVAVVVITVVVIDKKKKKPAVQEETSDE